MASCGVYEVPLLLTSEVVSISRRTTATMLINLPYVVGQAVMVLIAWLVGDYRRMHLIGYLPFLALTLLWFVIPESPRYVYGYTHTKSTEARAVVVSKQNHCHFRL